MSGRLPDETEPDDAFVADIIDADILYSLLMPDDGPFGSRAAALRQFKPARVAELAEELGLTFTPERD